MACTVNAEAFAYFPFGKMLPPPANNPYFLAFHSVIAMVADYLYSIGEHEGFEIVFDVNEVFEHKAKLRYPPSAGCREKFGQGFNFSRWSNIQG
jgi:hypothetical protein